MVAGQLAVLNILTCVGLPVSPDLKVGREVAEFLGTDHHEFTFTVLVRRDVMCGLSGEVLASVDGFVELLSV
jgi:hypothetical protein